MSPNLCNRLLAACCFSTVHVVAQEQLPPSMADKVESAMRLGRERPDRVTEVSPEPIHAQ
jgi:hypothetical protein